MARLRKDNIFNRGSSLGFRLSFNLKRVVETLLFQPFPGTQYCLFNQTKLSLCPAIRYVLI